MKKLLIFAAGMVVGAAVGTVVTVLCYQKEKEKNKATGKPEDHNGALVMSEEELTEFYIQQLKNMGHMVISQNLEDEYEEEDPYTKTLRSVVNPIDDEEEDIYSEQLADDICPVEPNPEPYEVPSHIFGNQEFYESIVLLYFNDDVMTDANYEFVDDWQRHIGSIDLKEREGSVYVRNEVENVDYEICIQKDSYKHAVEGEDDDLGDMAD